MGLGVVLYPPHGSRSGGPFHKPLIMEGGGWKGTFVYVKNNPKEKLNGASKKGGALMHAMHVRLFWKFDIVEAWAY